MGEKENPSEDVVQREIAKAVEILRGDRYITHSKSLDERLSRIEEKLSSKGGDPKSGGDGKEGEGDPPPKGDPKDSTADRKGRSLWWGDAV